METISREQLGDVLYFILNVAYMVITSLTMPIMFFGARNNFLALLKKNKVKDEGLFI